VMLSRDRHYRTAGIESRMEKRGIATGAQQHTLQWGLRFERHFLNDMRSEGATGEILTESNRGPKTRDEAYQASAVSAFFQDAIRSGDWLVTPGLRVESYTVTKVRHAIANDPGPHDPKLEDDNFLALPSLSLLYSGFGDDTQVFANVARGYTPAFARTAEDFPLDPETGVNSQLGLRTTRINGLALEAAVFYNRIHDTILQLPFTTNDMNIYLNSADSVAWGMDLGGRLESAAFNDSAWNWFAQGAWNYTHAEFTEDYQGAAINGKRVPEVPLHAGSLTFGFEHASGWHLSTTFSHFGSFFTDPVNTRLLTLADEDREPVGPGDELEIREPAVLGQVPDYNLWSARLSYTPQGSGMSYWVQGRNLGNKLYISDLENGIRPGAERTVTAGVSLQF
jgi:Fe(3+) dicitrate transport protein